MEHLHVPGNDHLLSTPSKTLDVECEGGIIPSSGRNTRHSPPALPPNPGEDLKTVVEHLGKDSLNKLGSHHQRIPRRQNDYLTDAQVAQIAGHRIGPNDALSTAEPKSDEQQQQQQQHHHHHHHHHQPQSAPLPQDLAPQQHPSADSRHARRLEDLSRPIPLEQFLCTVSSSEWVTCAPPVQAGGSSPTASTASSTASSSSSSAPPSPSSATRMQQGSTSAGAAASAHENPLAGLPVYHPGIGYELRDTAGSVGTAARPPKALCVAMARTMTVIVSANDRDEVVIWELPRGRASARLTGHRHKITACAVCDDGSIALTASRDGTLIVWNVGERTAARVLNGHTQPVSSCAISHDGAVALSGSWDKTLMVWSIATGACTAVLSGHTHRILSCALSGDGRIAVSSSLDRTVKVWAMAPSPHGSECSVVHSFALAQPATACNINSAATMVAAGVAAGTVFVWSAISGELLRTLAAHVSTVTACAFTDDGALLLTAASDTLGRVWDTRTGTEVKELIGHNEALTGGLLTPDGRVAVTSSEDGSVRIWSVGREARESFTEFQSHTGPVRCVAQSPDGRLILSGSEDACLALWDASVLLQIAHLRADASPVSVCAMNQDGSSLLSLAADGSLTYWCLSRKISHVLHAPDCERSATCCAISRTGKTLITAERGGHVAFWSAEPNKSARPHCEFRRKRHGGAVTACAISSNGRVALTCGAGGDVYVWNTDLAEVWRVLLTEGPAVTSCSLSECGRITLLRLAGECLAIFNTQTGERIRELRAAEHSVDISACCLSPDGLTTLVANTDGTVEFWDTLGGTLIRSVSFSHPSESISLTYVPESSARARLQAALCAGHNAAMFVFPVQPLPPVAEEAEHSSGAEDEHVRDCNNMPQATTAVANAPASVAVPLSSTTSLALASPAPSSEPVRQATQTPVATAKPSKALETTL